MKSSSKGVTCISCAVSLFIPIYKGELTRYNIVTPSTISFSIILPNSVFYNTIFSGTKSLSKR